MRKECQLMDGVQMKNEAGIARKATIKDVANYANVSTATVERALKGSDRIRESTKARVLEAVEKLGYQTNDVARALQNNRTYNILTLYHTMPDYFTENFTRGFAAAAENLKSRGLVLSTIRTPSLDPHCAVEALNNLDLTNVDALLIDCGGSELDECIARVSDMGIPVATFGSDSPSSKRFFYVGEDPFISGKVVGEFAGKFLGGKGSVVAFKGPRSVDALRQRTNGMYDVLRTEFPNVEILPEVEHNDDDLSSIRGAINILNRGHQIGCVFCNSAGGTLALYRAIKYLDLKPEDVPYIIGYDFNQDINDMLQENYCTVTLFQNPYQQAYNALNYMFEYINKNTVPPQKQIIIPCDFVFKHNAYLYLDP